MENLNTGPNLQNLIKSAISDAVGRELIGYATLQYPESQKMLEAELVSMFAQEGVAIDRGSELAMDEVEISPMSLIRGQLKICFILYATNVKKDGGRVDIQTKINITPSRENVAALSLSETVVTERKVIG